MSFVVGEIGSVLPQTALIHRPVATNDAHWVSQTWELGGSWAHLENMLLLGLCCWYVSISVWSAGGKGAVVAFASTERPSESRSDRITKFLLGNLPFKNSRIVSVGQPSESPVNVMWLYCCCSEHDSRWALMPYMMLHQICPRAIARHAG